MECNFMFIRHHINTMDVKHQLIDHTRKGWLTYDGAAKDNECDRGPA